MTRAQRLRIAAAVAAASALGSFSANAFWGSGPFGMFPGNWDGPGWGNWGSPWYGGYPYGGYGYPYGGYGYPYGGYGYPVAGYGSPFAWGAPVYGYPAVAVPAASRTTPKTSK